LRQVSGCGGGCFVGWCHHVQRIVYWFMKVKGYYARPAAATGSRTAGPKFTRRASLPPLRAPDATLHIPRLDQVCGGVGDIRQAREADALKLGSTVITICIW
jgi:hypothetical protein